MVQIKHFTALQKMPNFQFSLFSLQIGRSGTKYLEQTLARQENYCESK